MMEFSKEDFKCIFTVASCTRCWFEMFTHFVEERCSGQNDLACCLPTEFNLPVLSVPSVECLNRIGWNSYVVKESETPLLFRFHFRLWIRAHPVPTNLIKILVFDSVKSECHEQANYLLNLYSLYSSISHPVYLLLLVIQLHGVQLSKPLMCVWTHFQKIRPA